MSKQKSSQPTYIAARADVRFLNHIDVPTNLTVEELAFLSPITATNALFCIIPGKDTWRAKIKSSADIKKFYKSLLEEKNMLKTLNYREDQYLHHYIPRLIIHMLEHRSEEFIEGIYEVKNKKDIKEIAAIYKSILITIGANELQSTDVKTFWMYDLKVLYSLEYAMYYTFIVDNTYKPAFFTHTVANQGRIHHYLGKHGKKTHSIALNHGYSDINVNSVNCILTHYVCEKETDAKNNTDKAVMSVYPFTMQTVEDRLLAFTEDHAKTIAIEASFSTINNQQFINEKGELAIDNGTVSNGGQGLGQGSFRFKISNHLMHPKFMTDLVKKSVKTLQNALSLVAKDSHYDFYVFGYGSFALSKIVENWIVRAQSYNWSEMLSGIMFSMTGNLGTYFHRFPLLTMPPLTNKNTDSLKYGYYGSNFYECVTGESFYLSTPEVTQTRIDRLQADTNYIPSHAFFKNSSGSGNSTGNGNPLATVNVLTPFYVTSGSCYGSHPFFATPQTVHSAGFHSIVGIHDYYYNLSTKDQDKFAKETLLSYYQGNSINLPPELMKTMLNQFEDESFFAEEMILSNNFNQRVNFYRFENSGNSPSRYMASMLWKKSRVISSFSPYFLPYGCPSSNVKEFFSNLKDNGIDYYYANPLNLTLSYLHKQVNWNKIFKEELKEVVQSLSKRWFDYNSTDLIPAAYTPYNTGKHGAEFYNSYLKNIIYPQGLPQSFSFSNLLNYRDRELSQEANSSLYLNEGLRTDKEGPISWLPDSVYNRICSYDFFRTSEMKNYMYSLDKTPSDNWIRFFTEGHILNLEKQTNAGTVVKGIPDEETYEKYSFLLNHTRIANTSTEGQKKLYLEYCEERVFFNNQPLKGGMAPGSKQHVGKAVSPYTDQKVIEMPRIYGKAVEVEAAQLILKLISKKP